MHRSRVIVVGDVHGCLEELDELIRLVEYRRGEDFLCFLGDLMDRGPDPVGVVRRARELAAHAVLGNHDEKHLRWRKHQERVQAEPGYKNPMRPLRPEARAANEALSDIDLAWLGSLPTTLSLGNGWVAVHAGFEPLYGHDVPELRGQRRDAMLRVRYVDDSGKMVALQNELTQPGGTKRWAEVWKGKCHVVYGHHAGSLTTPRHDVFTETETCPGLPVPWHRWGIDTGCCFGGHLTAFMPFAPKEEQIVQVRARAKYAEVWKGDPS